MPVYTYRREDGSTFDIRQRFFDNPLEICPSTGQEVSRVIQPAGIIFKGSGFYVNDSNKAKNPVKTAGENGSGKSTKEGEKKSPSQKAKATAASRRKQKRPPPSSRHRAASIDHHRIG